MTLLDTLLVRLTGDTSGYLAAIDRARAATLAMQKTWHVSALGINSFQGAVLGLARAFNTLNYAWRSIKPFGEFNKEMTKSLAIIPDTTEAVRKEMSGLALDLSTKSLSGPEKLASAFYHLASSGMTAQQSMAALPAVERFAVAGAFDLTKATELLTDALSGLGLKAKDTDELLKNTVRVSDLLVRANQLSQTNVEELSKAWAKSAAVMKTFNVSMEEGVAVLAAMAERANTKGVQAGNAFIRIMTLTNKAALKNGETMKKAGVFVFDPKTGQRTALPTLFQQMARAFRNYKNTGKEATDIQKAFMLQSFGFEAKIQKVILPMIQAADVTTEYHEALMKAGGVTEKVASFQLTAFLNQLQMIRNQFKVMFTEVGEILAPAFLKIGAIFSKMIGWFRGLSKGWRILISSITATAVTLITLIPLLAVLGPLFIRGFAPLVLIGSRLMGLLHLSTLLKGLLLPLTLAANGIKLLGIALLTLINPLKLIRAIWFGLLLTMKVFFSAELTAILLIIKIVAVLAIFTHRVGGVKNALDLTVKSLEELFVWLTPVGKALASMFMTLGGLIQDLIFHIGDEFVETIQLVLDLLGVDWKIAFNDARDLAITAIVALEFAMKNFGKVTELAMATARYAVIRLENELVHFLEETLPALILGLAEGSFDFPIIPRIPTNVENDALKELRKVANRIGGEFKEFLDQKLKEFHAFTNIGKAFKAVEAEGHKSGRRTGEEWAGEFAKAMKKVEGVLVGSSEWFEMLQTYLDAVRNKPQVDMDDDGGGGVGAGADPNDLVMAPGGGRNNQDKIGNQMLDVLVDIRDNTKDQLKKDPGTLVPAGLA